MSTCGGQSIEDIGDGGNCMYINDIKMSWRLA
jgi:hypothetical protein